MLHIPVLLNEVIEGLAIKKGDIFVDGTLGSGGHSQKVCEVFGNTVVMIGIDLDSDAISRSEKNLKKFDCNIRYAQGNFRNINSILDSLGVGKVNKILLDIGLSSNQFEESGRGFSFQKNEPLVMSFKKNITENDLSASEIVNTWDEENIEAILYGYGEESFSRQIARGIVRARQLKKIETTDELVDIIFSSTPKFYHHRKIHPATKTFQALRITVNDEIGNLKEGLKNSFERLEKNGRLAIISFHSLEDRQVKNFYKDREDDRTGKKINKKPIVATEEEINENPRSRSAKLRIIEKI